MHGQPFSVLISLYHKENPAFLRQSLESIFTQTLPPDEIVLVEDGPLTEELYAVVDTYAQKYSILKVVALDENAGLGKALNEGMKHCTHALIARMDTDDIAKPDRFEKQAAIFAANPDLDVCGSWMEEFLESPDRVQAVKKVPEQHPQIQNYARQRNPINHPTVMFRKQAILAAGGYRDFPLLEDYYLWVRMLMNGAHFFNIQESLLYFRTTPDLFTRRGGLAYLKHEIRFQRMMRQQRFISRGRMLLNILPRIPIRLLPNQIRSFIYARFLRK